MRKKKILIFFTLVILLSTAACRKFDPQPTTPVTKISFIETKVPLANHHLAAFSIIKNSKYLVVFESGLDFLSHVAEKRQRETKSG